MTISFIKHKNTIIIGLFIISILAPNFFMFFNLEEDNKFTKSKSFPKLDITKPAQSIGAFKNYYLNNYGFKATLINNFIYLKNEIIKENPIPNRVIKGKENWYFLGNHFNNVIDDAFGIKPLSELDLIDIKKNLLKANSYFKNNNIDFYLVIPPNKNTIYKEKLPFKLKKGKKRIDQLKNLLSDIDSLNIIDLTEALQIEKDNHILFHKTDSHWNDFGSYTGYTTVINELNKKHFILKAPLDNYNLQKFNFQGDITNMINLKFKESALMYSKKEKNSKVIQLKKERKYLKYYNSTKTLNLLMFRDSFSNNWIKFYVESFKESVFIRDNYTINHKIIDMEKPDIVIIEIVERNLGNILKNLILK